MKLLDEKGLETVWSTCKTKFALAGHTHNYAGSGSPGGSANSAIGVVDYGQNSKTIQIGYSGTGISGDQIKYIAGYTNGDGNVNAKIKDVSKDALKKWLGIDSLDNNSIPTKLSQLINDKGFVTGSVSGNTITINGVSTTWANTWRGIQNNLTSSSTSDSLSANQGRILKGLIDGKANSSHTHNWSQISNVPVATTAQSGIMSSADKAKLNEISLHVPTLSQAPTSSTLTFVENGTTKQFKIGDICRVADSSSKYGYKFYQLYNIASNRATWGENGGVGGDYNETVTVTLKSTLSSSDSKLNGAVVTVKNTMTNETQTQTWNGTPLVFKIPSVNTYTVSTSLVTEYVAPVELSYTAGVGTSRAVVMLYKYIPFGVYIYDTDGNFTKANDWNAANNGKAVGVSLRTENSAFVIAPTYNVEKKQWSKQNENISGIVKSTDEQQAKKDYAGELNTDKIIAQLGRGNAPAAEYCRNYTFKNGKKGYLWSLGEAYDAYNNYVAINEAMEKIGGTYIPTNSYHWTSTLFSNFSAWLLKWGYGNVDSQYKDSEYYVRAVCNF